MYVFVLCIALMLQLYYTLGIGKYASGPHQKAGLVFFWSRSANEDLAPIGKCGSGSNRKTHIRPISGSDRRTLMWPRRKYGSGPDRKMRMWAQFRNKDLAPVRKPGSGPDRKTRTRSRSKAADLAMIRNTGITKLPTQQATQSKQILVTRQV